MKLVSLVKGKGRYGNIIEALSLIKKDIKVEGKKNILIKPNLTATNNGCANSNAEAARAIIDFLLKNFDLRKATITVADGSGSAYYSNSDTKVVLRRFGYYELEKKYKNVKVESLDDFEGKGFFEVPIKTVTGNSKVRVLKRIRHFDYIISLAIPKMHNYGIATFGIKNMVGFVKKEDRILIHGLRSDIESKVRTLFDYIPPSLISRARRNLPNRIMNILFGAYPKYKKSVKAIHHNIVSLAEKAYPDLAVIDGCYGMEGDGPIDGKPVKMDLCIASADALKADCAAARCIGFKPEDIGYLHYLISNKKGDGSLKGLVGDDINGCLFKFKRHGTYSIQKEWRGGCR